MIWDWLKQLFGGKQVAHLAAAPASATPGKSNLPLAALLQVGAVTIFRNPQGVLVFDSGMTIDADGSPHAYHPDSKSGLDDLGNAGRPGRWWGLATDEDGRPYLQQPCDPAPGFFVSTTSLEDRSRTVDDPDRYVDSETVPFIALPPQIPGMKSGDLALIVNLANGRVAQAIYGDIGPHQHLGEGSIALAKELAVPSSPRIGGISRGIRYILFPGSSLGWPVANSVVMNQVAQLYSNLCPGLASARLPVA